MTPKKDFAHDIAPESGSASDPGAEAALLPSRSWAIAVAATLLVAGTILIGTLVVTFVRGFNSVTDKAVQSIAGETASDARATGETYSDLPEVPGL